MMAETLNLPQYDHTILVVDDDPPSLGMIYNYLEEYGFEVMVATDGELALQRAEKGQPDIILLDILMPGMDGYQVCKCLKENKATKEIPVIFLTALGSTADKVKGFALGGVDYLIKPLDSEEVLVRILTQLKLRDLTRELERTCNEQEKHIQERTAELARANEELKAEISERKHKEALINLRLELINYAGNHSPEEVFIRALDEVEKLTHSKISFYHLIDDDQKVVQLQAWSTRTRDQFCTAKGKRMHYPLDQAGVWVECVHKRRTVVHNDYNSLQNKKGLPKGHAPVKRELVVPVFRDDKVVAILGVGNKFNEYSETDVTIVTYCADVVWEITERKRAEADLKESEERYRNLFEYSPISLFEQDFSALKKEIEKLRQEGVTDFVSFFKKHPEIFDKLTQLVKITDVNRAGLQMYEAICKADMEKSLQQIILPDDYQSFFESLTWITKGKPTHEWEGINTTLSGRKINVNIGCSVVPGYEDSFSKVLVFVRDITESKKIAEMREKTQQHLEALVKVRTTELATAKEQADLANAAKSDFLARMSHEIRTPLNAVTGLTSIVLKSSLTAEQRDHLNKIKIAAGNLLEVINDILDFSKIEAGRLELTNTPFDLDLVIEQLADLFTNRLIKNDVELVFTSAVQVPRQLIGDAGRLSQILINLVENAVKFTESGEIVVSVDIDEWVDRKAGRILLKFTVSDTGSGIAADVLPTLFEPFTQADTSTTRPQEGTGLGLAICRRLVELMGGGLRAESMLGQGSTFSFTAVFNTRETERGPIRPPSDFKGLKVLLVDDSASARQALGDMLKTFTFRVTEVPDAKTALETLHRAAADRPYQLVLMDWKMPGMDGIETATVIRNDPDLSHTPIIILITAYGSMLMKKRINTTAADALLLKPVNPSKLYNTIMELLGREDAMVLRAEKPLLTPARLANRRVLVVEDSALNRDVAVVLLKEAGIVVEIAENGQIAVDKVTASSKGYYDAVLMDIQMPILDGYAATREIRNLTSENRDLPIIALTAHALKGEKERCLAGGMNDYLPKPFDEDQLYRILFRWIDPGEYKPIPGTSSLMESTGPKTGEEAELDVDSALKRLGGRKNLYLKILTRFTPEFADGHDKITRYLKTGNPERAVLIAHSLKSAAASIGAETLSRIAFSLENALTQDNVDLENDLKYFKQELDKSLEAVALYLKTEGVDVEKAFAGPGYELSRDQLMAVPDDLLDPLHQAVLNFDTDLTLALIDTIARRDPEIGNALRMHAENLDYDRLLKLLENRYPKD